MINNRIAVMRAERRLSRKDLAAAIGVNYQTIGYLERGSNFFFFFFFFGLGSAYTLVV